MAKKKTHEEFKNEINLISNGNIQVVGKYIDSRTKVECYCKKHNYYWFTQPNTILKSGFCPKCSRRYRYTQEEFVEKIRNLNPNLQVLGKYINTHTKILFKCTLDGHVFESDPAHMLQRNASCPMCSGKARKTTKSFILEISKVNSDIEVIGDYINIDTPILVRCKIDNYEWYANPYSLLHGGKCPKCLGLWRRTTDEYKKEVYELFGDQYEILGDYIGALTPIKTKHKKCNKISYITPTAMKRNNCPCHYCERTSLGEQKIIYYLDKFLKSEYTYQKSYEDLKGVGYGFLSYDFYIQKYNLLIEYQGEFHDGTAYQQTAEEFAIQQEHDRRKREYAKIHGINLLEIWYWDFDNIENILADYLNLYNKEISA